MLPARHTRPWDGVLPDGSLYSSIYAARWDAARGCTRNTGWRRAWVASGGSGHGRSGSRRMQRQPRSSGGCRPIGRFAGRSTSWWFLCCLKWETVSFEYNLLSVVVRERCTLVVGVMLIENGLLRLLFGVMLNACDVDNGRNRYLDGREGLDIKKSRTRPSKYISVWHTAYLAPRDSDIPKLPGPAVTST